MTYCTPYFSKEMSDILASLSSCVYAFIQDNLATNCHQYPTSFRPRSGVVERPLDALLGRSDEELRGREAVRGLSGPRARMSGVPTLIVTEVPGSIN